MRRFDPATIARAPRPWLTRRADECAFPVLGQGIGVHSCCNPCSGGPYCQGHQAILRGPDALTAERYALSILTWLDRQP